MCGEPWSRRARAGPIGRREGKTPHVPRPSVPEPARERGHTPPRAPVPPSQGNSQGGGTPESPHPNRQGTQLACLPSARTLFRPELHPVRPALTQGEGAGQTEPVRAEGASPATLDGSRKLSDPLVPGAPVRAGEAFQGLPRLSARQTPGPLLPHHHCPGQALPGSNPAPAVPHINPLPV